ncbi:MAG: ribosome maturation factor RimP [Eubacterium aggregans]|uniref:ribosome maturation factor RimP n=1 Tax=Eubacterium aggregans TaxID=81409 RepID=UPI000B7EBDCA|nr:ribosome maturation factor RimP [Eubacterium aggregans]MDD4692458.1 ribosome maturation factor RimP [Eubacterium aggregans]MEA5074153.1 ribosome maturation factor RimP [Eubacterium aggregans]
MVVAKQSKKDYLYELLEPVVVGLDYRCVDVEFEKVGKDFILTVYIDTPGGVGLDDCEKVSRVVSDYLDEVDPIEQSYLLEVSSPGLDRPFKRLGDYEAAIGTAVDVRLFAPVEGSREWTGILKSVSESAIQIETSEETVLEIGYKAISKASPHIEF